MTKKTDKTAASETAPLSKQANDIAAEGLAGIGECIKSLREKIKGGDTSCSTELSLLTHKAAQIMGEARKRESNEAKQDLTTAQLVEYFRKLTDEQRAQWCRDITALNRRGSVL